MSKTTTRRRAKTAEHELCVNRADCAYLLTPGLKPIDSFYHMDFAHCRLCAVFWDQRDKIPCRPKHGLKE